MGIRKVALRELSKDVRSFLTQAQNGEGIVVEDETGNSSITRGNSGTHQRRTPA